jgi:hypothetical protein
VKANGEPGEGGGVVLQVGGAAPDKKPGPLFYEKGKGLTLRTLQM